MNPYWCTACGMTFRTAMAEARHRHNFPMLCRKKKVKTPVLPIDRFMNKIEMITESGCWIWMGCLLNHRPHISIGGHGLFRYKEKIQYAHRVSWELFKGPIPEGLHVLHRCDVPSCVNPDHLFLGTNWDNMNDRFTKHGFPSGEKNGFSKLTWDQIREIRSSTEPQVRLAERYGVSHQNISKIKQNLQWKES